MILALSNEGCRLKFLITVIFCNIKLLEQSLNQTCLLYCIVDLFDQAHLT